MIYENAAKFSTTRREILMENFLLRTVFLNDIDISAFVKHNMHIF